MLSPTLSILLVLVLLGSIFGGLWLAQQQLSLSSEAPRKGAHVLMGGVTVSFPWVFDAAWPVVVVCSVIIALFLVLRAVPALRDGPGAVLHRVQRESWGEICYPAAVMLLFVLADGDPLLYGVPMLVLTLADPMAALVGQRYGTAHYRTHDGAKSGEGSLGFFFVAFLCTHVPLLLTSATGRLESLLIGLIVGFVVMLLEAIAWRGLDNLFVPLGSYALLATLLAMDAYALAARLLVVGGLFGLATVWYRETTLDGSATFAAALVGVLTWMVGGWLWLIPPAVVYFGYTLLWPDASRPRTANVPVVHSVQNVLGVAAVGLGWLLLSVATQEPALLVPYLLAYAASLGLIGAERLRSADASVSAAQILGRSSLRSCIALLIPFVLILGPDVYVLPLAAGMLGAVLLTGLIYLQAPRFFQDDAPPVVIHLRRAALIASTSALGLPVLTLPNAQALLDLWG